MQLSGRKTRDPNRARAVLVHPKIHRMLADRAREEGYSIQDRLHLALCREFGRPDLADVPAVVAP